MLETDIKVGLHIATPALVPGLGSYTRKDTYKELHMDITLTQSKIVALNRYARQNANVTICRGTPTFSSTYAAVQKQAEEKLPHMMGSDVDWYPNVPGEITVFKTSSFDGGTIAHFQVPVEGAVAEAFLADMQKVAIEFAQAEILDERQRALRAEATARVLAMAASS